MSRGRIRQAVAAAMAGVLAAACATATQSAAGGAPQPTVAQSDSAARARARADSMRLPYTAADIQFMSAMIPHHSQALAMARLVPERTTNPAIRTLAGRIINAQQDEIALMQTWLKDRNQPVPEAVPTGLRMMMDGRMQDHLMPGMLTPEQMKQLEQARGAEFDRLFLTFMIQHHRGAVAMVKQLFDTHGAGQDETVFKFASDVNVDQSTEIARMESMLSAMGSAPSRSTSPTSLSPAGRSTE